MDHCRWSADSTPRTSGGTVVVAATDTGDPVTFVETRVPERLPRGWTADGEHVHDLQRLNLGPVCIGGIPSAPGALLSRLARRMIDREQTAQRARLREDGR